MTRVRPKQLEDLVELPKSLRYIWSWFIDLNSTRPSGFGIGNIQYQEMDAYFRLHSIEPDPWEVGVLKLFDSIAVSMHREQEEKNKPRKGKS